MAASGAAVAKGAHPAAFGHAYHGLGEAAGKWHSARRSMHEPTTTTHGEGTRTAAPKRAVRRGALLFACMLSLRLASAASADDAQSTGARTERAPDEPSLAAIAQLEQRGDAAARRKLEAWLHEGQADALADRALEALGTLAHADSLPVLASWRDHRRVGARVAAYVALAHVKDRKVPTLLAKGLRDADPRVRGKAADLLGGAGDASSVPLLLVAFERGVNEAAGSIGRLGDAAAVTAYTSLLGKKPLEVMLVGYELFLRRGDLPAESQLAIVAALEDLGTDDVRAFFARCLRDHIAKRPPVVRAIEASYRRLAAARAKKADAQVEAKP